MLAHLLKRGGGDFGGVEVRLGSCFTPGFPRLQERYSLARGDGGLEVEITSQKLNGESRAGASGSNQGEGVKGLL